MAAAAVSTQATGRYTFPAFHDTFIRTGLASADVAVHSPAELLRDWMRLAVTNTNAGVSVLSIEPVSSGVPAHSVALNRWAAKTKNDALLKLGQGGPALSSATFNTGAAAIQHTLDANANTRLQFE